MVEEHRGWITETVVVVNALRRWNRPVQLTVVTAVKIRVTEMPEMPEQRSDQLPKV